MGGLATASTVCDRRGAPHLRWCPTTCGKVVQFTTGDEREYPHGFCSEYTLCASSVLGSRRTFVEVFLGPNALPSREVCSLLGEKLKGSQT